LRSPTFPKLFLFCLPKRASATVYSPLSQCCSGPVPAPSCPPLPGAVAWGDSQQHPGGPRGGTASSTPGGRGVGQPAAPQGAEGWDSQQHPGGPRGGTASSTPGRPMGARVPVLASQQGQRAGSSLSSQMSLLASSAPSALLNQMLQSAAVYFKYHTNQKSKRRISLSIHKLLHGPSNRCRVSLSTSTATSAGPVSFLHQPAEYISETLGVITALATAAAMEQGNTDQ